MELKNKGKLYANICKLYMCSVVGSWMHFVFLVLYGNGLFIFSNSAAVNRQNSACVTI